MICLFYYDDFAEFEIVLMALQAVQAGRKVVSAAMENRVYRSEEHQRFLPDTTIDQLDPHEIEAFIIPGGDPSSLFENQVLGDFLRALAEENKIITAICGGPSLLAAHGLLKGRRCTGGNAAITPETPWYDLFQEAILAPEGESVVHDGPFITSPGKAFTDMGIYFGEVLKMYKDDDERELDRRWVKNLPLSD